MKHATTSFCCAASLAMLSSAGLASDTARLHNLLVQDCGSCHGLQMKGGLGPALLPANLEGKPAGLLVSTILEGRAGTAMPPWKALLSREDAAWMVERLQEGL